MGIGLSESQIFEGTVGNKVIPFLEELATEASSYQGPIVEIGSLFGFSLNIIASQMKNRDIYILDDFSWNPFGLTSLQHRRCLQFMISKISLGHKIHLFSSRKEFFKEQMDRPALVFIDASHQYEPTLEEIRWAQNKRAQIISGHDYSESWPGVMRAVDECGGTKKTMGSLWSLIQ